MPTMNLPPILRENQDDDVAGKLSAKDFLQQYLRAGVDVDIGKQRYEELKKMPAVHEYHGRLSIDLTEGDDFLFRANREYFEKNHDWFPRPFDLDDFDSEEEGYRLLGRVDDDDWDRLIEDLKALEDYPCLDDDRMSELEMEALDVFLREDGLKDFKKACKKHAAFQNSFLQYAVDQVTSDQLYELLRNEDWEVSYEEGSAWLDMERAVRRLDDPVPAILLDADGQDREPVLRQQFQQIKQATFQTYLRQRFEEAAYLVWQDSPETWTLYTRLSPDTILQAILKATPDEHFGTGDPAWYEISIREAEGQYRTLWTVALDDGSDELEALTLIAEKFQDLVKAVIGDHPNQLKLALESRRLLEVSLEDRERFEQYFKNQGHKIVWQDDTLTLREVWQANALEAFLGASTPAWALRPDSAMFQLSGIVQYVITTAHQETAWFERHRQRGTISDRVGTDDLLNDPDVRKSLVAFFTQALLADLKAGDYDSAYITTLVQLRAMDVLMKLAKGRYKDLKVPGLAFSLGLEAGFQGRVQTARRWLQDADHQVEKEGVWVLYDDLSDLVSFFDREGGRRRSARDTARDLFAGDAYEWFDTWDGCEAHEALDYFTPTLTEGLKALLVHRQYTDPGTDETQTLMPDEVASWTASELRDFVRYTVKKNEAFDDIKVALKRALAEALALAAEGCMYRTYTEAVTEGVGAIKAAWLPQEAAPEARQRYGLFFTWTGISNLHTNFLGDGNEPWAGTIKDLLNEVYNGTVTVSRDEFWETPDKEDVVRALEYQLGELDETPAPRPPEDPSQPQLPLGEQARRITRKLLEESYDYSCLMIDVPKAQADFLQDWARVNIPDESVHVDEKEDTGRERHTHITVLWGIQLPQPNDVVRDLIQRTRTFPVQFGTVGLFRKDDCDVVMVHVESPWLRAFHARLKAGVPNVQTYPTYTPHCTLAYVKKGSCDALEGQPVFGAEGAPERTFYVTEALFSAPGEKDDPDRKTYLPLLRDNGEALAEDRAEADPFGQLPFPSDASRVPTRVRRKRRTGTRATTDPRPKPVHRL